MENRTFENSFDSIVNRIKEIEVEQEELSQGVDVENDHRLLHGSFACDLKLRWHRLEIEKSDLKNKLKKV